MKNILIVDTNQAFMNCLSEMLGVLPDVTISTSATSDSTLDVINDTKPDLLFASLASAGAADYQLLRLLDNQPEQIPTLIFADHIPPQTLNLLDCFAIFDSLSGALDFEVISDKIQTILHKGSKGHIAGVSLASFLQLVELDRKTCTLRIKSAGQCGVLYFDNGDLIDAYSDKVRGEDAALDIVGWSHVEIDITEECRKTERQIDSPLGYILIEGARRKDEQELARETNTPPPDQGCHEEPELPPALSDQDRNTLDLLTGSIAELGISKTIISRKDGTILAATNSNEETNDLIVNTSRAVDELNTVLKYTGPQHIILNTATQKKLLVLSGPQVIIGLEMDEEVPANVITASLTPLLKRIKLNA